MGDTRPLGSEKLNNDEKLKRILELTYYNSPNNKNKTTKPELVKESISGNVYGIVKEKDGYYVKKGINESSLDYIGGMFMKNKNKFSSYAEALKRMELLRGQEQLNEATKYVLKTKSKTSESPAPSEPVMDDVPSSPETSPSPELSLPPAPGGESPESMETPLPSSEDGMDTEPSMDDESNAEKKRSDYMSEIQKYAGKLGQEIRDQKDRMESDDIKYVLNMIISAVDLDKLELEDLEEVREKFERDEESLEDDGEVPSEDEMPSDDEESIPSPESDTTEPTQEVGEDVDPMKKLESFESWDVNEMDEDYMGEELAQYEEETDEIIELDLDEIKHNVNKSVGDILNKYFSKM